MNRLALQVLFWNRNRRPVDSIPTDYETNPDNYSEQGQLLQDRQPEPEWVELFVGMQIVLTKNLNKEAPEGPKRLQEAAGGPRRPQEAAGGRRRPQGLKKNGFESDLRSKKTSLNQT